MEQGRGRAMLPLTNLRVLQGWQRTTKQEQTKSTLKKAGNTWRKKADMSLPQTPSWNKEPLPEVSDNGLERGDRALPTLLGAERWEGKHRVDAESTRPSLNPSSGAPLGESLKSCWTLVSTCLYYSLTFYFLPECSWLIMLWQFGVYSSDSVIHVYMHLLFLKFFTHLACYIVSSRVPWAIQ